LAPGALALPLEDTDHLKRDALDPDGLSERFGLTEEFLGHRLAEDNDLGCAGAFFSVDRPADVDVPIPNAEELGRHRVEDRDPVLVAVDEPDPAGREGGRDFDERDLALEGPGVLLGHGGTRTRAEPRSTDGRGLGPHEHQIGAHALDLLGHALAGPGAQRHHRDHGGDADDHSERGQRRA
jgi:hypothetical protein